MPASASSPKSSGRRGWIPDLREGGEEARSRRQGGKEQEARGQGAGGKGTRSRRQGGNEARGQGAGGKGTRVCSIGQAVPGWLG